MRRIKSALFFGLSILSFLFIHSNVAFGQKVHSKRTYNIVDYGAVADGKTLNTKAIQSAIDAAYAAKGGKVIFPKGRFLTGSIEMKSDVNIYLDEGAVLLGSTNSNDYKAMNTEGRPVSPKSDDNSQLALILAYNANNISVSGKGLIDGQGRALA
ncbi:MAG: glycosyl hydrolase family 28-related protein, partial [Ginsengibacter sp.]